MTPCKQPSQSTPLQNFSLSRNCQEPIWHFLLPLSCCHHLTAHFFWGVDCIKLSESLGFDRSYMDSLSSEFAPKYFELTCMFCVPCIVIYSYVMLTNKINVFKINVLIQFFLFSTCLEHVMFITRKTILYIQPYLVHFSC